MPIAGARLVAAVSVVVLCFGACSAGPEVYTLRLRADGEPNQNDEEIPTPVSVRIYQLKDAERFKSADFDMLWRKHEKALAGDLVHTSKIHIVTAGFNRRIEVKEPGETEPGVVRYVGLVALFNKELPDGWRVCIPVADVDDTTVSVRDYLLEAKKRQSP